MKFLFWNIASHAVNAGIWEELEIKVAGRGSDGGRAERYGTITIIIGPIYDAAPEHLRAGITAPSACFSVIIREPTSGSEMLALKISNSGNPRGPLNRYIVSVNKVEDDTGLDLFAGQPEQVRVQNETNSDLEMWR